MARLNARRALEDYKGSNNDFFKLENDMDVATVRFLYDNEDDLDIYAVHEVEIGGKKRYVECLQNGCVFCEEAAIDKDLKVKVKFFIQLEDEDEKVKTWERGQQFIPKILGMFNKYGPLCNRLYEIERHGKPNDTKTTYELYALDKDDMILDECPEKQELLGDFVLQWDEDKMTAWLNGEDVGVPEKEPEKPVRQNRAQGRATGAGGRAQARGSARQADNGGGNSAGSARARGRNAEPEKATSTERTTGTRQRQKQDVPDEDVF